MRPRTPPTAQLSGTVHDQQGALIPGATVTITDDTKGFSRTTTADAEGTYHLLLLPPGTYKITVASAGFRTEELAHLILTVGETAELPITLKVGAITVDTEVNANADVIETQRSSQSTTIDQLKISGLPINGRNYINFTLTNSQIARDAAPAVGAIQPRG